MLKTWRSRAAGALLLIAATSSPSASSVPFFSPLTDVLGAEIRSAVALDVSTDGSVVVGYMLRENEPVGVRGFRWSRSAGTQGIWLPGSTGMYVASGSPDGSAVVGTSQGEPDWAFHWTASTGAQPIEPLAFARAVSNTGVVVGCTLYRADDFCFRWTEGGGTVPIAGLRAGDISADGAVIAGSAFLPTETAALWREEVGVVPIEELLALELTSSASAVSPNGQFVVGSVGGQSFRWAAGDGVRFLGQLSAVDVNDDGTVVGASNGRAAVWDPQRGMRLLEDVLLSLGVDLQGWELQIATGISADGRTIVGDTNVFVGGDGTLRGWIVQIPEPRSVGTSTLGAALVMAARRLRARGSPASAWRSEVR